MHFIDFHTHIYPEKIAAKATKSICDFYDLKTDLIGTPEVLIEHGNKVGVTGYVILTVATRPDQTHSINKYAADVAAQHDNFYVFGTMHAGMTSFDDEIQYCMDSGFYGIKMHPDIQGFAIDDERLDPMYDAIQGKLPVFLHTGDYRYTNSHPSKVLTIKKKFPKLQVICAHLGGWSIYSEAYELLKGTDCLYDMSSSLDFMSKEEIEKLILGYGADRVFFGTDFPLHSADTEVPRLLALNIPDGDKEKIAYKNAEAFLGISK